eukprot:TRINITY_DN978_c1_g1_i1.p1 TRINITY_DN978_c1_g1~~TRINITY_DN978_c1_g1_i1.p1  ORF type:complete len:638 (-),score=141.94 TRINITY_DN978_c1_g1_i1:29-1942(-)
MYVLVGLSDFVSCFDSKQTIELHMANRTMEGGLFYYKDKQFVPWTYWTEWCDVFGWLFSSKQEERSLGVKRVYAWRARGCVPVFVELTSDIVETTLRKGKATESDLKGLYSRIIVRLRSYVIELYRGKQHEFPDFIKKVRNRISHEDVPELDILSSCVDRCFQWLYDFYWKVQSEKISRMNLENSLFREEFKLFVNRRKKSLASKGEGKEKEILDVLLNKIVQSKGALIEKILVPTLLTEGYLIPESKPGKERVFGEFKLPKKLSLFWADFLLAVQGVYPQFAPCIIYFIGETILTKNDYGDVFSKRAEIERKTLLLSWLKYFLFFKKKRQDFDPILLLTRKCLLLQDEWSKVLSVFLHKRRNNKITELVVSTTDMNNIEKQPSKTSKGKEIDIDSKESVDLLKLMDLGDFEDQLQRLEEEQQPKKESKSKKKSKWQICTAWNNVPLGLLPDYSLPNLVLPLELDDFKGATFLINEEETEIKFPNITAPRSNLELETRLNTLISENNQLTHENRSNNNSNSKNDKKSTNTKSNNNNNNNGKNEKNSNTNNNNSKANNKGGSKSGSSTNNKDNNNKSNKNNSNNFSEQPRQSNNNKRKHKEAVKIEEEEQEEEPIEKVQPVKLKKSVNSLFDEYKDLF